MRLLIVAMVFIPTFAWAQAVTRADRSGAITTGGQSQVVMGAWSGRHGCEIENISSGDLWINDLGGNAAATQPSYWLPAGSLWLCGPGSAPATAIAIFGATTGQSFVAREW